MGHRVSLALLMALGLIVAAGCGPTIQAAHQTGGHEAATWIYVQTNRERDNGVFRCEKADSGKVACTKATMQ